ncbi:hypothetical protein BC826DRAFT_1109460 [Russula brevipes]|nr:hypothetical protein BC826DRAFT_1109460 [Russula brevipes]
MDFCQKSFLNHLVNFIVADDQLIYVIECPEFRELLLYLLPALQDNDIPWQSKIREAIIDKWGVYFDTLKEDLKDHQENGKMLNAS